MRWWFILAVVNGKDELDEAYYRNERAKQASKGTLTFFICGIHYKVPLSTLYNIYGFQNAELEHTVVPSFEGRSAFWGNIATCFFDSGSALQTGIRHPTLRYFMKVLANTLSCMMEPSKTPIDSARPFAELHWSSSVNGRVESAFDPARPFAQLGWSSSANGRAESAFDPARPFAELDLVQLGERSSSENGRAESVFDPARPFAELDLVQLGERPS
ncbi:hypothetical protein F2Q70_00022250 [Brassica cretica]|uniref:Arabidopsis retrotransposon Orf1 C-terminal domain-containing protein n=1 Tax=Brassica cretica TaxID=69181 RepID=A0A8S9GRY6_BRACR|nr:hypothetical protein F2Q70_00022250 [Brassica cretica]